MKKFSKITAIIIVATLMLTMLPSAIYAADSSIEKVEIVFKVGDSTLMINDNPVTVETPFIVEGTTMVPLRVITEAFGTEVNWEGETKTITLLYDDVTIVLQIGNITATVNNYEQTLLEAPVLSENGSTMVPLRFISETFGADVGWDEKTSGITVVKEKIGGSAIVNAAITNALVGDSFYGWQIARPKNMSLEYRGFDGTTTIFAGEDDETLLMIVAEPRLDSETLDTLYSDIREGFSKSTIMKADKIPAAYDTGTVHLQAKDKMFYTEYKGILTTKFSFSLILISEIDLSDEARRAYSDILETFKPEFSSNNDIHDFSNVKDGFRVYKDDKYKVEFKVPATWVKTSDESKENVISFNGLDSKGSYSGAMALGIYSKPTDMSLTQWAAKERDEAIRYYSKSAYTATSVETKNIGGIDAAVYEYTYTLDEKSKNYTLTDMFFYIGDYAYNFTVYNNSPITSVATSNIASSFKAEEISGSEVGSLLFEFQETEEKASTITSKSKAWSIPLNSTWEPGSAIHSGGYELYYHNPTGSMLEIHLFDNVDANKLNIASAFKDILKLETSNASAEKITDIKEVSLSFKTFYKFTYKISMDDVEMYVTHYMFKIADRLFDAYLYVPSQKYYDGPISKEAEAAMNDMKLF